MAPLSSIALTGAAAPAKTVDPSLKKAAQAFEAVFVRQIMSSMRQASLGDDLFGNQATEQFRDLADARTADDIAAKGAFGIADMLIKQFEGKAKLAQQAPGGDAAVAASAAAAAAGSVKAP